MAAWADTTLDGGGWGGEASFATQAPTDSAAQRIGDRVPLPITIHELITTPTPDDKICIGQISFGTVMFMGRIDGIQELDGGSTMQLDVCDPEHEESHVQVHILTPLDGGDVTDNRNVREGSLIMVVGKPRKSNETISILVLKTREITDRKEYECFKVEAQISRMYFEKNVGDALRGGRFLEELKGCPAGPPATGHTAVAQRSGAATATSTQERIYSSAPTRSVPGATTVEGARKQLLEYLHKECPNYGDAGIHVDQIATALHMDRKTVEGHLNYLTGEGEAFQTVDEQYSVF